MKILAIDLGKFKSVTCLYTDSTADHTFATLGGPTDLFGRAA